MESKPLTRKEISRRYYLRHISEMKLKSKNNYWNNRDKYLALNKEWCKENNEKRKEHRKKYYKNNKEKCLYRNKEYRLKNPDVNKRAVKRWRLKNINKAKRLISEWSKKNKDRRNFDRHQRQNMKRANGGERITSKHWNEIKDIFGNECFYCGKKEKLTVDHYYPIKKGGGHFLDNIVPACGSCNSEKGTSDPELFKARKLSGGQHG